MGTRRIRLTAVAAAACGVLLALAGCSSSGGSRPSSTPNRFTPAGPASASTTPGGTSGGSAGPSASDASSGTNTLPAQSSNPPPLSSSVAPVRPVPAKPLTTLTVQGQHTTYHIKVWAQDRQTVCSQHAYGQQVVAFLTAHPCRGGVYRRIATTTVDGRAVGFNQAQLSFTGADPDAYRTASQFQQLVSQDGTGNITDMLRDGYRLPSGPTEIPSPDAFKALSQDSAVTITDAWYLNGVTPQNDPALTTMAEDLFLQF